MIYQMTFEDTNNRHFIIESTHPIYTPKRYRNWFGQLLEHAPFCERDLRSPQHLETHNELGSFVVKIKKEGVLYDYVYDAHLSMLSVGTDTISLMPFQSMILNL